jgi:hypothetical protein
MIVANGQHRAPVSRSLTRKAGSAPEPFAVQVELGQVQAHVEFDLVVLRLHPAAQLVERLVELLLLQVGQ